MEKIKIIFISRAYPPIVGGIETQNYELGNWLGKIADVKIIANTRGRKFLPIFAPFALLKALFLLPNYDAVLLGDGVISILAWFIKIFSKKPVLSVVHGLDINWNSASLKIWSEKILIFIYQNLWVEIFLPKIDHFIAVGNETVLIAQENGIAPEKITFIPNGIDPEKFSFEYPRQKLGEILPNLDIENNFFLLTSGRLAKRKGVAWFIRNVMPKLAENVHYVVAGSGPDKENIAQSIKETGTQKRVHLLGYIPDEERNVLFGTCDLFIQPNIKIEGDMEGFGISVIEAAASQIPVLASNIEGLKDAIKDGENGFLIESENTQAYAKKINELLPNKMLRKEFGAKARQFVIQNYSWEKISQRYLEQINKTLKTNA